MPDEPVSVEDIDNAPDDAAVALTDTVVSLEDYQAALARIGEEKDALRAELETARQKAKTIEILDSLIKPYAERTFYFMCVYCGVVALMLLMHGCKVSGFKLPESVLQFLVGSTATTVIGLVGMVLTGIFVGARRHRDS